MVVLEPPVPGFIDFVRDNAQVWNKRADARRRHNAVILVELIHNNATLLCLNLIAARYLAQFHDADVVGFTAPVFTRFPVAMDRVRALAASFGVTDVVDLEAEPGRRRSGFIGLSILSARSRASHQRDRHALRARLEALAGEELRHATLGLEADGIRIGDLIYDSYLYYTGQPTLESFDERLDLILDRGRRLLLGMKRLLAKYRVHGVVIGDKVYVDYGIPARAALKHRVPVYVKFGLNPSVLSKYTRLEAATSEDRDDRSEILLASYRTKLGPQLASLANRFYPPAPSKVRDHEYFRFGYGDDKHEESGDRLAMLLNLDRSKKTCCLMAHMFIDAPHFYPGALFDDHFQWLSSTLEFGAKNRQINWLVRQHPYEVMTGQNDNFNRACAEHAASGAVKIVPSDVTTSSLFSCVDAITTVHGTAGIEFASAGIPCILAGRPFYGDYAFAMRPRTRFAYFEALAGIPTLGRVTTDAVALAKEVAYVEFKCAPVVSKMIPETGDLAGRQPTANDLEQWWHSAAVLTRSTMPEDDPLFRGLRRLREESGETLKV